MLGCVLSRAGAPLEFFLSIHEVPEVTFAWCGVCVCGVVCECMVYVCVVWCVCGVCGTCMCLCVVCVVFVCGVCVWCVCLCVGLSVV